MFIPRNICSAGLFLLLFFPHPNVESGSYKKIVIRPSFEKIHTLITESDCMIKKSAREKLAVELKHLDNFHCSFMEYMDYSLQSPENIKEQIINKTGILPSPVPLCERSIIYILILQVEMLDLVLEEKDQKKAFFLREKRKRKRILPKSKKIYGDFRDVYFFLIIDLLGDISKLHRCFGVGSDITFDFPVGLEKTEVEAYLRKKISLVSQEAEKLLNQR